MVKNTAGQKIGAQMTTAADGTDFTSTVTVYVTLDAGTQAIGTVGSGICTHEGHGYHTYAPSQAETNGDLLAYTFVGSGAVSVTLQERGSTLTAVLGTPVTSLAADIAAVKADTGLRVVRSNTAQAGSSTTITLDASASSVTDFYKDGFILIGSGTGAKQGRICTAYNGTSKVATVARAWATNPDNTSVFTIYPDVPDPAAALESALSTAMPDSIPANGSYPSIRQAIYILIQWTLERTVSGTTVTVRKPDHSTSLLTGTLNDGTSPTSVTRAT